jgi:fucose permease
VPIGIATVLLGPMLPTLSARWSLNYSQAGALFTAQYLASTCAVGLSGFLVERKGFLFAMKAGLLLMAAGLALLMSGSMAWGIFCIAVYGVGLGLATPASNLLVAEINPERRSETLNWLNFFWSAGAVSCPFLVAAAAVRHQIPFFLAGVCALSVLVALGIAFMPGGVAEPATVSASSPKIALSIPWTQPSFLVFAALFFIYVGTENSVGGWAASYAKSLGNLSPAMSLMTPSFFYAALMVGRWLAPFLLRHFRDVKLAQGGLFLACIGTAGMVLAHGLGGVIASACAAGFGLAAVYPISIALMSNEFPAASSRVGSVMFVMSNIGGGALPWAVGIASSRMGTLKVGLILPLVGAAAMFLLFGVTARGQRLKQAA